MNRKIIPLCLIAFVVFVPMVFLSVSAYTPEKGVESGEIIEYGYVLRAGEDPQIIEVFSKTQPKKQRVVPDVVRPIGLYERIIGLKLGQIYRLEIPPDEGFSQNDPEYGHLAGKTLYYMDLQIYKVHGYTPSGEESGNSIGSIIITTIIVIGSIAAGGFVSFVIYRSASRVFAKRCKTCKKVAVGKCSNCGRAFCNRCYSSGCPYCKGRKLILF